MSRDYDCRLIYSKAGMRVRTLCRESLQSEKGGDWESSARSMPFAVYAHVLAWNAQGKPSVFNGNPLRDIWVQFLETKFAQCSSLVTWWPLPVLV